MVEETKKPNQINTKIRVQSKYMKRKAFKIKVQIRNDTNKESEKNKTGQVQCDELKLIC